MLEFGIDDFITPLYNSAVRERDKPGEDISCSMANNFPKNFQETVIFHLTTMASTCREEGFGKKREREGKKREKKQKKKKEEKKQEGKNEQKISPLLTYRIILPISPQRAPTSRVRSNERSYRRGLHCAAGVQQ